MVLLVRPRSVVVGAVLTAALALVAAPGLAGSRMPTQRAEPLRQPRSSRSGSTRRQPATAAASMRWTLPCDRPAGAGAARGVHRTRRRAGGSEAPGGPAAQRERPVGRQAASLHAQWLRDLTTTTGRRPCACREARSSGSAGRRVRRAGHQRLRPEREFRPAGSSTSWRPDFFAVCGCPSFAGTSRVTVGVY